MLWCFCAVCYYQMQQLFNVPEKYNNLSFGQLVVAGVCSRSLTHCCTLLTLEVSCFMEGKDPKKNFVKKKDSSVKNAHQYISTPQKGSHPVFPARACFAVPLHSEMHLYKFPSPFAA